MCPFCRKLGARGYRLFHPGYPGRATYHPVITSASQYRYFGQNIQETHFKTMFCLSQTHFKTTRVYTIFLTHLTPPGYRGTGLLAGTRVRAHNIPQDTRVYPFFCSQKLSGTPWPWVLGGVHLYIVYIPSRRGCLSLERTIFVCVLLPTTYVGELSLIHI